MAFMHKKPTNRIRVVLLADTHLGFDHPVRPRTERRRRGPDFFDNFRTVLNYAVKTRADLVVHGGDLFFRKRVPRQIINLAYACLVDFADHGIPFFVVPGNHERSELPASLFTTHPLINIFDKPRIFSLNLRGARVAVAGFPFERVNIRERFPEVLDQTGWQHHHADIRLLCMHQAVSGARVGISDYTFRHGQEVVRVHDLPRDANAILCGHIHRHQILTVDSKRNRETIPIIYPGSTERTSFAERGEDKGFCEVILGYSSSCGWHIDRTLFHKLPARPMVDLFLDGDLNVRNLREGIQSRVAKLDKDVIVRLRCSPTLDSQVKELVTSSLLRELLPITMNFQFSSDFYSFHKN